ncbi:hypothetical protein CLV81_0243 [Flagellimonas meridianipacifica]|uniref:Uncharacterized protein n=2 Tax=Flavobacteriaceae TaxID=49546 RepID=A0A2T0MF99_9FLAO|nr:hypothetical protein CLV81_0243 [Allomuricauda pacifica]
MNLDWDHIVYIIIGTLCLIWYVVVFRILRTDRKKNLSENKSFVQKINIFAKNESYQNVDMDQLLNQVNENETSSELLDIFSASDTDEHKQSLIPKENEKLKVIKNTDDPPEGDPKDTG